MVTPWRMITGAEPYTMKVVRAVLNGGREETYSNATRLAPPQLPLSGFQARLRPNVRLLSRLSFTSRGFCPRICIIDAEDTPCRPKPLTYMRHRPTWSSCYHWWL